MKCIAVYLLASRALTSMLFGSACTLKYMYILNVF